MLYTSACYEVFMITLPTLWHIVSSLSIMYPLSRVHYYYYYYYCIEHVSIANE